MSVNTDYDDNKLNGTGQKQGHCKDFAKGIEEFQEVIQETIQETIAETDQSIEDDTDAYVTQAEIRKEDEIEADREMFENLRRDLRRQVETSRPLDLNPTRTSTVDGSVVEVSQQGDDLLGLKEMQGRTAPGSASDMVARASK